MKSPAQGLRTKKIKTGLLLLGLSFATLAARADTLAYAAIDGGDFGTLDLSSGVYSQMSVFPTTLAGLANIGGALYGAPLFGDALYQINPTNGLYTTVGTSTISYYDFGSTLTGLYALDQTGNLYSINPATGAVSKDIGNVNLGSSLGYGSLSDNSGTFYLINQSTLYTVNTGTAQVTEIGGLKTDLYTSLLATNGELHGVSNEIYTLNPQGAGLPVSGESGAGVYGLAPDPLTPVPVPPGAVLLLSGVALLIVAVGGRRARGDMGLQAAA